MPVGIQRLNDPHPQPSSQIIFIKPLPGPNAAYAKDFLERIAAISHPIMKHNHLSIMTLEEHEPNSEFVGRNFNAGEIIQLVLKSQRTGQWLSFRTVQMVMMHELAHCMQMNHSRGFWKVRNRYAEELKQLWSRSYTGDGLWGRGQTLLSGRYDVGRRAEEDVLPKNLCGGAYRSSRRRKRKMGNARDEKMTETYAARQQRKIAKKFGVSGQALGGDNATRVRLEKGQKVKAKPKVANSARGRELRVQAAVARFRQQQEEAKNEGLKQDKVGYGSTEWSSDDDDDDDDGSEDLGSVDGAVDQITSRLHDVHGRDMIRVCGGEDQDDVQVKRELDELRDLEALPDELPIQVTSDAETTDEDEISQGSQPPLTRRRDSPTPIPNVKTEEPERPPEEGLHANSRISEVVQPSPESSDSNDFDDDDPACPICSMTNAAGSLLCSACSHVLDPSRIVGHWRCQSSICADSVYLNAGDCGLCGVCGERKVSFDMVHEKSL